MSTFLKIRFSSMLLMSIISLIIVNGIFSTICVGQLIKIENFKQQGETIGFPIVAEFDIHCPSDSGFNLEMNYLGLPKGIDLQVFDSEGRELEQKKPTGACPSTPLPASQRISLEAEEKVRLGYDLRTLFDLEVTGTYKLVISVSGKNAFEAVVGIRRLVEVTEKTDLTGIYWDELEGQFLKGKPTSVRCSAVIAELEQQGNDKKKFALVVETKNDSVGPRTRSAKIELAQQGEIKTSCLDFHGRCWLLLRNEDGDESLFVWAIESNELSLVLDWGSKINFRYTRVAPRWIAYTVVVGRVGQGYMTSTSWKNEAEGVTTNAE